MDLFTVSFFGHRIVPEFREAEERVESLIHTLLLEKEYVESARAIGTSNFKIITKYIMPNSFAPILIAITFQMASAILTESSLSFLGMGVQTPQASWGNIIYAAQNLMVLTARPWVWIPPGVCIILVVIGFNFIGEGVRDALDPKTK